MKLSKELLIRAKQDPDGLYSRELSMREVQCCEHLVSTGEMTRTFGTWSGNAYYTVAEATKKETV